MSSYSNVVSNLNNIGTSATGQQIPRKSHENLMVKNSADGYTYTISDEDLIDRILILGTSSNTYYSSAEKLTADSMESIKRMLNEGKGQMLVEHVSNVYESGRAPKQDPTFFVLALLTQSDVPLEVRKSALQIVSRMRTFTQLYSWVALKKQLANGHKGFGRATRSALLELFKSKTGKQLIYQTSKYGSRKIGKETWTIGDVISCAHIASKKLSMDSQVAVAYMINGIESAQTVANKYADNQQCLEVMQYLYAVEAVKKSTCTTDVACQMIRQYNLPRETLSSHLLNDLNVWNSLLYTSSISENGTIQHRIKMPITALIRNLGVMSSKGVFDDEIITNTVAKYLTNKQVLKCGRVHPVTILVARITYESGRGVKGSLNWKVSQQIVSALEEAFYVAFGNIDGTGKRILHAVDCSGSMSCGMCAIPNLTACQAVSTLVMEAIKREHKYHQALLAKGENSEFIQDVVLFKHTLEKVNISHIDTLNTVMKTIQDHNFGSTDCALPMINALETYRKSNGKHGVYDAFIVYTDNETYYGKTHPSEALDNYNKEIGICAKMIVIATTPTNNSIGFFNRGTQPNKDNCTNALNISGFDLNAPELIRNFINGNNQEFIETKINEEANVETEEYEFI